MLEPKLKQDEPMDTGETTCDGNFEEGEIPAGDDGEVFCTQAKPIGLRILDDSTSYGLPPSSIQELKKLSRAKRFGIPIEHGRTALVDTGLMTRLYKSLGIDKENEKHYRFNVVHMRGTQNMSTEDVHEYFTLFQPSYIEWINDVSCNVVWTDHFSAAKALLNLSKEIKNLDKIRFDTNPFKKELESSKKETTPDVDGDDDVDDDDAVDAREIEGAIPPGHWRIGVPAKKSQTILLRLATRSDKKKRFAEKNSEYYKKYGNPHFWNIPGIVSNSLRNEVFKKYRHRSQAYSEHVEDKNKKNPWGNLAEKWRKQDEDVDARSRIKWTREGSPVKIDLRLSLNNKQADMPKKQMGSDSGSSQPENDHSRDKFPKMKMYADEEGKLEVNSAGKETDPKGNVPFVEDLRLIINRSRKRKQMIEEDLKNKRMKNLIERTLAEEGDDRGRGDDFGYFVDELYDMFDDDYSGECVEGETEIIMKDLKEYNTEDYDNFYESDHFDNDEGDDDDDDDDDEDDEEKCSRWALENYSDLRESLAQSKHRKKSRDAEKAEKSKSDAANKTGDDDNDEDDIYKLDINHRSPLQIEFENDDYFEKEST